MNMKRLRTSSIVEFISRRALFLGLSAKPHATALRLMRSRLVLACAIATITLPASADEKPELARYETKFPLMGTTFTLTFYAADEQIAREASREVHARLKELNSILSDYDPNSELSKLSRSSGSGRAVEVSDKLWKVLAASMRLAIRTDGAFDVSVGPIVDLWRAARKEQKLPLTKELTEARRRVGYEQMVLDPKRKTVQLTADDMRLDLGGIAKGYAADEAMRILREHGITRALVDAGGDLALGDSPPEREGWRIGVAPLEADGPPSRVLSLANVGVATSGDRWQFVEIDGVRYSHIVDPKTGLGLTGRRSVTVIAPNCMLADGVASAVSVLGAEKGIALADETKCVSVMVIQLEDGDKVAHASKRMRALLADE